MSSAESETPAPRLCHLFKWPDFDGYGFNLHGEKLRPGQYIGKVDKDSPAELAGLKLNDRIVEVNGTNISNENHKQVVLRIKAIPNETKLLVVDERAEQYYKDRGVVVTGEMPNVAYAKTPVPRPSNRNNAAVVSPPTAQQVQVHQEPHQETSSAQHSPEMSKAEMIDSRSTSRHSDHSDLDTKDKVISEDRISENGSAESPLPGNMSSMSEKHSQSSYSVDEDASSNGLSPTPPRLSASPSPSPTLMMSNGKMAGSLNFNMTAQEMRAKLAAAKRNKHDAKNAKIDAKKKYDIIQTL